MLQWNLNFSLIIGNIIIMRNCYNNHRDGKYMVKVHTVAESWFTGEENCKELHHINSIPYKNEQSVRNKIKDNHVWWKEF